MRTTGRFSIGKDALARYLFAEQFVARNPRFKDMVDMFANCKAQYQKAVAKQGCSCRVGGEWAAPCISAVLDILETAKKTDHETIRNFIRFVGQRPDNEDVDGLGVTVVAERKYDIFVDSTL